MYVCSLYLTQRSVGRQSDWRLSVK